MPVALITGGNRGLGLETGRQLKARGWRVILTSRDPAAGARAAADIGGEHRPLDVSKAISATALAASLEQDGVVLDLLVNNAGVSLRGFDPRVAEKTLAVNLHGALAVTGALAPRLRSGGHVVMVSSGLGELAAIGEPARSRIQATTSREEVARLGYEFVAAVAAGRHQKDGWPANAYAVSKALLNAATRALAPRDVTEGAASIVATALDPRASGAFFRDGRRIPW
jgi:carbonyl reductase 1